MMPSAASAYDHQGEHNSAQHIRRVRESEHERHLREELERHERLEREARLRRERDEHMRRDRHEARATISAIMIATTTATVGKKDKSAAGKAAPCLQGRKRKLSADANLS